MPYLTGVITPQDFNAVGNGVADDTAAVNAAVSYLVANGGGPLFLPGGSNYAVTPTSGTGAAVVLNNGSAGFRGVRIVGSAEQAASFTRLANGPIFSLSGPASDTTGVTHCRYCTLENVLLNGNGLTGPLVQTYYADTLYFNNVHYENSNDVGHDCAEFWDSRFYNCLWDTCGSSTANATAPNLWLRNTAASSGFGYSAGTTNNIYLFGCRWEQYKTGAVRIERGVGTNSGQPYSLYFVSSKLETATLNGGPTFFCDTTARDVRVENCHAYVGGFQAGYSTAQDVFTFGPQFGSLRDVLIFNSTATACIANGVTVNSPLASGTVTLSGVRGSYTGGATPTGAHIGYGTLTGAVKVEGDCGADAGTQWGGTTPTIFAANNPLLLVNAGVVDGDFPTAPQNGTLAINTLATRLQARINGAWQYIPFQAVSQPVTSTTTINTTGLQTLQTATVPANDAQVGSVYVVRGSGVWAPTGTGTATFGLYWGGTGGTLLASIPTFTPAALTNAAFDYEAIVTFRSTTSCVAVLRLTTDTSTSTDAASTFVGVPASASTVATTSNEALAVGFTWATSAGSISLLGGYTLKMR